MTAGKEEKSPRGLFQASEGGAGSELAVLPGAKAPQKLWHPPTKQLEMKCYHIPGHVQEGLHATWPENPPRPAVNAAEGLPRPIPARKVHCSNRERSQYALKMTYYVQCA